MTEHLEKSELKLYGLRELRAPQAALVVAHLAECEQCMKEYRAMFTETTIVDRGFPLAFEDEIDGEPFHLDFDEHLKPYVDRVIDDLDKEIVEGHIQGCSYCAEMLRDLQEFSERISGPPLQVTKPKPGLLEILYSAATFRRWIVAFSLLIILGTGAAFWYFSTTFANREIATVDPPSQPAVELAATDAGTSNTQDTAELAAPPNSAAESKFVPIRLPAFLGSLRSDPPGALRGEGKLAAITVTSANGVAVRSTPRLNWKAIPGIGSYDVSIYDADDNLAGERKAVTGSSWSFPNLAKGKIYKWQVTANSAAGSADVSYRGQGSFYLISSAEEARIEAARDAIEKGRALAEAGLVREAAAEFRRVKPGDPRSKAAQAYLNQLGSH
jgi:hypothetical protein